MEIATRWPAARRNAAQRSAVWRLPLRWPGPAGVTRLIFIRLDCGAGCIHLTQKLRAARQRTRRVVDDLAGERELGPQLAIVNPPRWEVGHLGWFQEFWCLRGGSEEGATILPNADALYNSATVPHDARWTLPLPSFAETLAYRDEVLERVIGRLNEGDPYFAELALRHEQMHAEAFHYTRQTLGYPASDQRTRHS